MDNNMKPKFEPKTTGKSSLWMRIQYLTRIPKYRTIPAMILGVSVYLAVFNIGMRYWMGDNHPINRYGWQRMVAAGELPEDLKKKEQVVASYYKSRILNINDPPQRFQ